MLQIYWQTFPGRRRWRTRRQRRSIPLTITQLIVIFTPIGDNLPTNFIDPKDMQNIPHVDDLVENERKLLKTARGSKIHACPFCSHQSPLPGRSQDVKNHAFPGLNKNGNTTKGCPNYLMISDLFRRQGITINEPKTYDIEDLTKHGRLIEHWEREKPFWHYVLNITQEKGFSDHPDIISFKNSYSYKKKK